LPAVPFLLIAGWPAVALLEYQNHCVGGQPDPGFDPDYPLGSFNHHFKGLYRQISWAATQLSVGYYGWRDGTIDEIRLSDGRIVNPAPEANAGSVALQYYFAQVMMLLCGSLLPHPTRG